MARISQYLAVAVLLLGVVSLVMGTVFIVQGIDANRTVTERLRAEKVTLGIPEDLAAKGDVVDNSREAEAAAETLSEHRRGVAPTYGDLLEGGRYDPTNPNHVSYAQAINLENSLNLAVLSYGVATVAIASGTFMAITGIALGVTGVALFVLARRVPQSPSAGIQRALSSAASS